MEEILASWIHTIRSYIRSGESITQANERARNAYFGTDQWAGFQWKSVKAATASAWNSFFAGKLMDDAPGDYQLARYEYGVNPSLGTMYRYSVAVKCTPIEGGPVTDFMAVIETDVAYTTGQVRDYVNREIEARRNAPQQFGPDYDRTRENYAICTQEILFAERRTR